MNNYMFKKIEKGLPLPGETVVIRTDAEFERDAEYLGAGKFNVLGLGNVISWKRKPDAIRALNWKEPFGSLMLHGKVETRVWNTEYRGMVLLCASRQNYTLPQMFKISGKRQTKRITDILKDLKINIQPGTAFAVGRLVDCRPMRPEDCHLTYTRYKQPLYCHFYDHITPIKPFEWPGYQGWKKLNSEEINRIIPIENGID